MIPVTYLHMNSVLSCHRILGWENPQEDGKTGSYRVCLWKIRSNLWKMVNICVERLGNLWGKLKRKIRFAKNELEIGDWGLGAEESVIGNRELVIGNG